MAEAGHRRAPEGSIIGSTADGCQVGRGLFAPVSAPELVSYSWRHLTLPVWFVREVRASDLSGYEGLEYAVLTAIRDEATPNLWNGDILDTPEDTVRLAGKTIRPGAL